MSNPKFWRFRRWGMSAAFVIFPQHICLEFDCVPSRRTYMSLVVSLGRYRNPLGVKRAGWGIRLSRLEIVMWNRFLADAAALIRTVRRRKH